MRKNWTIRQPSQVSVKELSDKLGISQITSRLLVNRGITGPDEAGYFLKPRLADLYNPYLLKDMEKAVSRIKSAVSIKENILIYGDYDADGLSAAALLISMFKKLGIGVWYYIPDRLRDGYGLNEKIIDIARDKNISLVVTVDCGISAFDIIKKLSDMNVDVIITDHHELDSGKVPEAFAVINPLQPGCDYPFKYLAGVGLAFKLAQAMVDFEDDLHGLLDLVCLGTIADVVPLIDENRILVKYGLSALSRTKRPGIKALKEVACLRSKEVSARNVSHILGPRINAQGRLGSPEAALKLLLTESTEEADELAQALDSGNRKRQEIEQKTLKEALAKVEREINFKDHRVIVLSDPGWHKGVIGIVASRIVDAYYRPAIMVSLESGKGKGSGRSIKGFDLMEALTYCRQHLDDFGGHEAACGLVVSEDKLESFAKSLNEFAHKKLKIEELVPSIEVDAEVDLEHLNTKVLGEIESLAPFGCGNRQPVFLSREVSVKEKLSGYASQYQRLWAKKGRVTCQALMPGKARAEQGVLDLVYTPEIEKRHGLETIRLRVQDFRQLS